MHRDDNVRNTCFHALDVLRLRFGPDIPWSALVEGFVCEGVGRVPFMSRGFGIYRSKVAQRGPAALTINSSFKQTRYQDEETDDGWLYHYQAGPDSNYFNSWLLQAWVLQVPLVYFIGTGPNLYQPQYPMYILDNIQEERRVLVGPGKPVGVAEELAWVPIQESNERKYVVRQVKQRVHQSRFRSHVIPAYRNRCAICSLKEVQLLDAAHIIPDANELGEPLVRNGVSLCTIHHRAYDQQLVGISPVNRVHVARKLLEEEDGPMLELLKGFHGREILLPSRAQQRPDPERLAARFDQFLSASE